MSQTDRPRRAQQAPLQRPGLLTDPVATAYIGAAVGAIIVAVGVGAGMYVTGPMLHSRPAPTVTATVTVTATPSPSPTPSRSASPSPSPSRR